MSNRDDFALWEKELTRKDTFVARHYEVAREIRVKTAYREGDADGAAEEGLV